MSSPTKEYPILTIAQIRAMSIDDLMPFLKDVRSVWRTASLFVETCDDPAKYPPIFTLKDDDTASQVSLKRLYLAMEDPTEYQFAKMCLGGWDHWRAITASWIVKPFIEIWRRDLDLQMKAKYLRQIKELSESDAPVALAATKYLLEETTSHGKKRGRPSKQEKEGQLIKETRDAADIKADMERLGLTVN